MRHLPLYGVTLPVMAGTPMLMAVMVVVVMVVVVTWTVIMAV
jgi:hypothetical protein